MIEDLAISHEGNQPYGVVTVSIGLIEVPPYPDSALEPLMSKAKQIKRFIQQKRLEETDT